MMQEAGRRSGTINRDIWRLAWPQMLMMVFHFLIGFTDVWVAGRISSDVQASLGIINELLFFFLIVAMATANGAVAAISQSMGAGLPRRMARYVGLVLEIGLAGGACIVVLGWLTQGLLLDVLQVPERLLPVTRYFLDVYLLVLLPYSLFVIVNAVFRARRRVMIPLFAMASTTVLNTFGDLGLGLGWFGLPELGYKGLAWSTFASITGGVCFGLFVLWREGVLAKKSFPPLRWIRCGAPYLWKVSWPNGLMSAVWRTAYIALFAITASLPEESVQALAGMTAGMRVESGLFLPGFAFNMTASILVGQYLGRGEPEEAKRYAYRILLIGVAAISLLSLVVWHWVWPISGFVAPDPAVQRQAVDYLFYNILAIPFTLTTMILAGALAGAGATIYNLFTFGVAAWGVRIPLAYVLGHGVLGTAEGIWISMLASQAVQAAVTLYIFQFHNWQRFSMRKRNRTNGEPHEPQLRTHHAGTSGRVP